MINLIYDFISNTFLGDTTIQGADDLAILLTFSVLIACFFCLVRLVRWAFGLGRSRRWKN